MGLIKLQVINPDIIRVVATTQNSFTNDESLMVINDLNGFNDWQVKEKDGEIVVETDRISAHVNKIDGSVYFSDQKGRIKLRENTRGRKLGEKKLYNGDSSWFFCQEFDSPPNEAFYGLGQHQNGEMNYKGKKVDLFQHNIVASVPFLVSGRNYGILWDNNSRTKFGNLNNYKDIKHLNLFSVNGESGGLSAIYHSTHSNKVYLKRKENTIDYEYLDDLPKIPGSFPLNEGTVTWEGFIEPNQTGEHF